MKASWRAATASAAPGWPTGAPNGRFERCAAAPRPLAPQAPAVQATPEGTAGGVIVQLNSEYLHLGLFALDLWSPGLANQQHPAKAAPGTTQQASKCRRSLERIWAKRSNQGRHLQSVTEVDRMGSGHRAVLDGSAFLLLVANMQTRQGQGTGNAVGGAAIESKP